MTLLGYHKTKNNEFATVDVFHRKGTSIVCYGQEENVLGGFETTKHFHRIRWCKVISTLEEICLFIPRILH